MYNYGRVRQEEMSRTLINFTLSHTAPISLILDFLEVRWDCLFSIQGKMFTVFSSTRDGPMCLFQLSSLSLPVLANFCQLDTN